MKPDTPDTPYILAYTIDEVDDDCREGQRYFINILISSQTLMDTILRDPSAKCLMIDTTHGLSVDKLLLCLVGTCNKYQEFICLSLTTNENTRSATQCLKWVKERHQGALTAVMALKPLKLFSGRMNLNQPGWCVIVTCFGKLRTNYDFAAKFNDFAAKISPLIFNVFAVNFLRFRR